MPHPSASFVQSQRVESLDDNASSVQQRPRLLRPCTTLAHTPTRALRAPSLLAAQPPPTRVCVAVRRALTSLTRGAIRASQGINICCLH